MTSATCCVSFLSKRLSDSSRRCFLLAATSADRSHALYAATTEGNTMGGISSLSSPATHAATAVNDDRTIATGFDSGPVFQTDRLRSFDPCCQERIAARLPSRFDSHRDRQINHEHLFPSFPTGLPTTCCPYAQPESPRLMHQSPLTA